MNTRPFYQTKIIDIKIESPTTKRFFIEYGLPVSFQSGQFVILKFPGLNHTYDTRSYSISDIQYNNQVLELCIVIKPDGAATPLIFNYQIGDSVFASLPEGRFTLPLETLPDSFGFICTGTGVAPFRAMIKDLLFNKDYQLPVHLYFGCRTQKDILYYEEFRQLEKEFNNFKYTPVLSREEWSGAQGYIHPHYMEQFKNKPNCLFYLCGWTESMKEARNNLKAIGYTRDDIKVEFYD